MSGSRADLAVPLLLQSPPGQVSNVYEDLHGLITCEEDASAKDEQEFKEKVELAREEHNVEQLIVVDLPEGKGKTILSKSNIHPGHSDRFIAPRHRISFKVDHVTHKTSDPKPYKENQHIEPLRSELEKLLSSYVADRYATGVVEVIAVPLPRQVVAVQDEVAEEARKVNNELEPEELAGSVSTSVQDAEKATEETPKEEAEKAEVEDDPVQTAKDAEAVEANTENSEQKAEETKEANHAPSENAQKVTLPKEQEDEETNGETKIVIHIAANKYKLSNFWSGRWRSSYTLASSDAQEIEAESSVHIHYFEDGNVQLHTRKGQTLDVKQSTPISSQAASFVKAIEKFEEEYQQELFKQSSDLSEGAFRALRRQLPMTRQKIDWDKVRLNGVNTEIVTY
ncbi:subunits of heterodimeric actin filament capping protein Capz [Meira miltonrushii]|uniref:Subunits of heterodimeric actin filament capping protein Capz n=1 Tax=Meira miltonrushii TaxID=1280837 RepID=A0A316VE65_9BASI|nr:subunits of heterodimeric actin filament capping protein Capz [Meira miltonrushii]PWN33755.1 subunits of heterodimeric actin filament capping protein Capz [Meira miltonrushii]